MIRDNKTGRIRIGTRKSALAMAQTRMVQEALISYKPDLEFEIVPIVTEGDKRLDIQLEKLGGKGVFINELEDQLLAGNIDIAIHSAKDMPMRLPEGLTIAAISKRADPRDVVVSLAPDFCGGVIGTSSLRREIQALRVWPASEIKPVRGNVQTRLNKLASGQYDALILAAAGLERLGLIDDQSEQGTIAANDQKLYYRRLSLEQMLPAAGQGIMAVEARAEDHRIIDLLRAGVHDPQAEAILLSERSFVRVFDSGCNAPLALMAAVETDPPQLIMRVLDCRPAQNAEIDAGVGDPALARAYHFSAAVKLTRDGLFDPDECADYAKSWAAGLPRGRVVLVGAGPGRRELITLRGAECLSTADVVVYDRLAAPSLLGMARSDAKLIYVGKSAGRHTMKQEDINQLLVRLARQGLNVVRLKGGDPFVFGRGGEEAAALRAGGQRFEIVPGISSATAVPLYAGIPVTHRGVSAAFHVITGQDKTGQDVPEFDFAQLASLDGTLICLMGLRTLPYLINGLIAAGKHPQTDAATISCGTTSGQRVVRSQIANLCDQVAAAKLQTPALTVIGPVVNLADQLSWFETGPLAGKRILITRTRSGADPSRLARMIEALGGEAVELSLIEIRDRKNSPDVRAAVRKLSAGKTDWLVLTSENGVRTLIDSISAAGRDIRSLGGCKIAAIGRTTANTLNSFGLQVDFIPSVYTSEQLAAELVPMIEDAAKVMLFGAADSSYTVAKSLNARGISYDRVAAYETVISQAHLEALIQLLPESDAITFASGSAVRACSAGIEQLDIDERAEFLRMMPSVFSIGPVTTDACEEAGFTVCSQAAVASAEALLQAIVDNL
ncbi:MAG: uroporphyrinogen-III C-methyltransferase [Eubacteriales bacterium]|nr:uroporphyrinogen-III C-methyltransferase [Eubacteriales bacterium]